MWIFLSDAFVSIVNDTRPRMRGNLLVRARRRECLQSLFPGRSISFTQDADYPYRVSVRRDVVAGLIAKKIAQIDYPNFKNSVHDYSRASVYGSVWAVARELELADDSASRYHFGRQDLPEMENAQANLTDTSR